MVPGVIGYIPEYRGVTGTPRGLLGLMGRGPSPQSELDKEGGGGAPPFLSPSLSFPLLS